MNKFLTIIINFVIWSNHANLQGNYTYYSYNKNIFDFLRFSGILGLLICLSGALFYKQAPMKGEYLKIKQESDLLSPMKNVETDEFITVSDESEPCPPKSEITSLADIDALIPSPENEKK